jgi:nucleotide-binding universal stress UspA family protein
LHARAAEAEVSLSTQSATGSAFRVAIRAAIAGRHDLVVKTFDRGAAAARSIRGSTDSHLLRKCPCALWLVHPEAAAGSKRVLAAVNPDPADIQDNALSVDIVRAAATVAALDGAELHVLHAWKVFGEWLRGPPKPVESDPEVDFIIGRALTRHADFVANLMERAAPAGHPARTHVVHARAADAIIDFVRSEHVDLLVIGTVGRTGVPGLLIGSTAEQVLNEVTCSVLALKPRGFVSPVTLD